MKANALRHTNCKPKCIPAPACAAVSLTEKMKRECCFTYLSDPLLVEKNTERGAYECSPMSNLSSWNVKRIELVESNGDALDGRHFRIEGKRYSMHQLQKRCLNW